MAETVVLRPVILEAVDQILDRKSLSEGITACAARRADFASELEMQLAGIAMVPEARQLLSDALTRYWAGLSRASSGAIATARAEDFSGSEIVIGAGFHAAVYCANRVRTGFPRPVVLEQGGAEQAGGAFAMSLRPVFRLNSRNRPGLVGLPDQDKALNYLPGGLLQPSMMTSEEYPANADMAWLIRLTLAQYADVYPGIAVTGLTPATGGSKRVRLTTSAGDITAGRVIDARGLGTERDAGQAAQSERMLTFSQLMAQMGGMFPLRGMQQVAVIGSGDSARCAAESLLGIAPGHRSAIGLDYVQRVDLYSIAAAVDATCAEFRTAQRGRYIRLAQFLEGNVSNPSVRLRVLSAQGFATPLPDGVLVNNRTYDLVVLCTGSQRDSLKGVTLGYFPVQRTAGGTVLATQAAPFQSYRIGPAADLPFTPAEEQAGISEIPANKVSMFRLAPRTAALALMLGAPETN